MTRSTQLDAESQKQGSGIPFLLPEGQVGPQVQGDAMHVGVPDPGLAQAEAGWRGSDNHAVAPLLSSEELLIQNMICRGLPWWRSG